MEKLVLPSLGLGNMLENVWETMYIGPEVLKRTRHY